MGVRGLQSFLEKEKPNRRIKISDEIGKWKRQHPEKRPIIIIDFYSLTHPLIIQNLNENICGGRHQKTLNVWKKLLDAFKAAGCSLVFFADLNIQETKIDTWLSRRNSEFKGYIKLYDALNNGENRPSAIAQKTSKSALSSLFHGLAEMAKSYGHFYYSVRHEADLEIAHYANHHKALAVISDDTDFLIFKGQWRLWSSHEIIRSKLRLRAIEYNRNSIGRILSLTVDQLPLFATLVGNDITNSKTFNLKLDAFFRSIGPPAQKIRNVAKFIRDMGGNIVNFKRISDNDIRRIVRKMFGNANNNSAWEQLIRSSIDSYNTDYSSVTVTDPIEASFLHSNMYASYMENMGPIQVAIMSFYDLRGCTSDVNMPRVLTNWIKRRKGILMNATKNPSNTFTLLIKKSFDEKCMAHTETLTYPDFPVPPLDELYSRSNEMESMGNSIEFIRWKLFGWIMSFSDTIIVAIRQLPKTFSLICATLYALVKNQLISVEAADGILYTENAIRVQKAKDSNYPKTIEAGHVRAAHVYNIGFAAVRENFAIAGLLSIIEQVMEFDGVFFQKHMEQMTTLNDMERKTVSTSIQKYRIYATTT